MIICIYFYSEKEICLQINTNGYNILNGEISNNLKVTI